jgi:hypothetical protein
MEWDDVKAKLMNIENKRDHFYKVAGALVKAMVVREDKLFQNELFCAAVFVDPRTRGLFLARREHETGQAVAARKNLAKEGLFRVYKRLDNLSSDRSAPASGTPVTVSESSSSTTTHVPIGGAARRAMLCKADLLRSRAVLGEHPASDLEAEFQEDWLAVDAYAGVAEEDLVFDKKFFETPVFAFIEKYPTRIQEACNVVSSLPVSQASVNTLFKGMKFHQTDLQNRMSDGHHDEIMFLHLNNFV